MLHICQSFKDTDGDNKHRIRITYRISYDLPVYVVSSIKFDFNALQFLSFNKLIDEPDTMEKNSNHGWLLESHGKELSEDLQVMESDY